MATTVTYFVMAAKGNSTSVFQIIFESCKNDHKIVRFFSCGEFAYDIQKLVTSSCIYGKISVLQPGSPEGKPKIEKGLQERSNR